MESYLHVAAYLWFWGCVYVYVLLSFQAVRIDENPNPQTFIYLRLSDHNMYALGVVWTLCVCVCAMTLVGSGETRMTKGGEVSLSTSLYGHISWRRRNGSCLLIWKICPCHQALDRRPKFIHQYCAKGSPTNTLKALWCICISLAFPLKTSENKLFGIHQISFLPVEALDFSERKTPLVYTFFPPNWSLSTQWRCVKCAMSSIPANSSLSWIQWWHIHWKRRLDVARTELVCPWLCIIRFVFVFAVQHASGAADSCVPQWSSFLLRSTAKPQQVGTGNHKKPVISCSCPFPTPPMQWRPLLAPPSCLPIALPASPLTPRPLPPVTPTQPPSPPHPYLYLFALSLWGLTSLTAHHAVTSLPSPADSYHDLLLHTT